MLIYDHLPAVAMRQYERLLATGILRITYTRNFRQ